jgi:Flp pilus assembly protein TadB
MSTMSTRESRQVAHELRRQVMAHRRAAWWWSLGFALPIAVIAFFFAALLGSFLSLLVGAAFAVDVGRSVHAARGYTKILTDLDELLGPLPREPGS